MGLKVSTTQGPDTGSIMRRDGLICLLLVLVTSAVYLQARHGGFVDYDDPDYITQNHHLNHGITLSGVTWAFTACHKGNWHPLTWLSHMLDCQLFGLDASAHHVVSLLFHLANTVLLFFVFRKMTGDVGPSAFVAALFALHPLHVESVAWVSERKDVLSCLFWVLTMWAYVHYVDRPSAGRYVLVLSLLGLGLMAKPMLVTLPCVLLLLDYWPLRRLELPAWLAAPPQGARAGSRVQPLRRLVLEKIPMLGLAAASCVATVIAEGGGGTIVSVSDTPFSIRAENVCLAYVAYGRKMLWPNDLAVFYPYPTHIVPWHAAAAALLLAGVSVAVVAAARRRPFLAVGWFWYLGTLVPVIGWVQVGHHAMADRYTYIPLTGLFIILAWGVPQMVPQRRHWRTALHLAAVLVLGACAARTWAQVGCWRNTITLFSHALAKTTDNYLAHGGLGLALADRGDVEPAAAHLREALRINPDYIEGLNGMGILLAEQGRMDDARPYFERILRLQPEDAEAHNNLALILAAQGRLDEAIDHHERALQAAPNDARAHDSLGVLLARQGKTAEAAEHYRQAIRISPDFSAPHVNLGILLAAQGKFRDAVACYRRGIELDPDGVEAHINLGLALAELGDPKEAAKHFREALRIDPANASARQGLAAVLGRPERK